MLQNRTCVDDEFKCKNGECIPNNWVCNGDFNGCSDRSDEDPDLCKV